jgi:hypothetical protein
MKPWTPGAHPLPANLPRTQVQDKGGLHIKTVAGTRGKAHSFLLGCAPVWNSNVQEEAISLTYECYKNSGDFLHLFHIVLCFNITSFPQAIFLKSGDPCMLCPGLSVITISECYVSA